MKLHRITLAAATTLLVSSLSFAQTAPATAPAKTAEPKQVPVETTTGTEPKEKALELDVFQVTTSADVGYTSTNAAEAVRMNTPIENIPMNVTVFNQQFMEDLMATDTNDVLEFDAASVKRTENDGFLSRGNSSVNSTLLNGLPQTSGFGAQPLANIERVEVLRGPAAILFGTGGFGGVYNRITKRAGLKQFVNTRGIFSDEGGYRYEIDYNAGAIPHTGKKVLFRLNGVYARNTTWFGTRKIEEAIAPTITWNITRKTSLTVDYIYNFAETQAVWETPLSLGDPHGFTFADGTYHFTPRKTNWAVPEDFRRNTRTSSSADFRHAFTDNLQFRGQFQYETREQDLVETVSNGSTVSILRDTVLVGRYWRMIPRITRTYRTRNELVWNVETGPIKHRLLGGFAWDEQYDDQKTYQAAQPGTTVNGTFNITYAQFLANPALAGYTSAWLLPVNMFDRDAEPDVPPVSQRVIAPLTAYARNHTSSTEYYANDVFSFLNDRVYVMAGIRHSEFDRATQNRRTGAGNTASIATTYPTVNATAEADPYTLGAVWHLTANKQFSLYGNMNSAFTPDFNVNPDGSGREPNTGDQKEIGLKFNLFRNRIQGTFAYWELLSNSNVADPDNIGYTIRADGARSKGYELNFSANLTKQWYLMGGASQTESLTAQLVPIDLQPKWRWIAVSSYKFDSGKLKGLGLTGTYSYTGERGLTNSTARGETNWGPAPGYGRVDAVVSYRFKVPNIKRAAWNVSFKVANIFDEQDGYYVLAYHRYTTNAGRTWQGSVGVKF
ncbi:TonB-dependent siderophore receptor [Oleiharenicola lentus]|uniref:TonB-dependent siderophore receptor n=1 Tax=Oleiharenicola lentus TaxID=2508720 RepID=UPI003F67EF4C